MNVIIAHEDNSIKILYKLSLIRTYIHFRLSELLQLIICENTDRYTRQQIDGEIDSQPSTDLV